MALPVPGLSRHGWLDDWFSALPGPTGQARWHEFANAEIQSLSRGWNLPATRFDPIRYGFFHYVLYAHARATPKSLPCLDSQGDPTDVGYVETEVGEVGNCTWPFAETPNIDFDPDNFHVPSSTSGIANLPGSGA